MTKKILFLILSLLLVVTLGACNNKKPTVADNTEFYDAITKTCKLKKSYEGKDFLTEGIGKATVDAFTDGDTTRFRLESGDTVAIRYYEIDTPESTGSVEKWGKAASNFTKSRLSGATEIVLEATASRAEHDSYGTRYLGYVWYKDASSKDFKLLNLEIVENGFSEDKGMNTDKYPYYEYFYKATQFAQSIKLRVFSKLDDPLYSDDPIDCSIKELVTNIDAFYNSDSEAGSKVRFTAYLTDLTISNSGTYTFTATQYDEETGKTYNFKVYAMYSSNPASDMKVGHLFDIIGDVQKYNNAYQISGISYSSLLSGKGFTQDLQSNYYMIFDSSKTFTSQFSTCLYSDLTVTGVNLEGSQLTIVATAQQRNGKDTVKDAVVSFTLKVTVPATYSNTITVGSVISTTGLQKVKNSNEIQVLNFSDIKTK